MTLVPHDSRPPDHLKGAVVAIGNFDGVHRGHQALLEIARAAAGAAGRPWGIVTFEPHPRSVFRPDEPVFRLSPLPVKRDLIRGLGASFCNAIAFDRALASLEAEAFVERHLVAGLAISHAVSGYDFHFGRSRRGNPDLLRRMGDVHGFAVTVVDQVTDDDGEAPFSSSTIRANLRHGHLAQAAHQLGYHWTVIGDVVEGDRRGRTIGFPTANIVLEPGADPLQGIYAVRVRDLSVGGPAHRGAAYFGYRPTFATDRLFLEVHLLDFAGDLYGHRLAVEFAGFIRPDRAFDGAEALVAQMTEDCRAAAALLAALDADDPVTAWPLGALQAAGRLWTPAQP